MAGWVQPTLGGASVKRFDIHGVFVWPAGWRGYMNIKMEGELEQSSMVTFSELTTPELLDTLRHMGDMLQALLGEDG